MKVVELLKIGRNLLEVLQNSCIKMNDVKFIQMYDEYKKIEQKNMKVTYAAAMLSKKYPNSGKMVKITPSSIDEMEDALKQANIQVKEECIYDALYLWNMTKADYEKSLPTKEARAVYIDETINDPDGCQEAVLACFCAKMDLKEVPIHWERFL